MHPLYLLVGSLRDLSLCPVAVVVAGTPMSTPLPLTILTTPELAQSPELQADAAKGHRVVSMDLSLYDVVLAPNAFRTRANLLQYRELAYKETRAAKRAVKKGTR